MKRLTFDGVNDLYQHPLYGARTLDDIARMDAIARTPRGGQLQYKQIECSTEMFLRNERHIDKNGCGMFGD